MAWRDFATFFCIGFCAQTVGCSSEYAMGEPPQLPVDENTVAVDDQDVDDAPLPSIIVPIDVEPLDDRPISPDNKAFGPAASDLLDSATLTFCESDFSPGWSCDNLIDSAFFPPAEDVWQSASNEVAVSTIFDLGAPYACFDEVRLFNHNGSSQSITEMGILTSTDPSLATDTGHDGWTPIANPSPAATENHALWLEGSRLTLVDGQTNPTTLAADNLFEGNIWQYWSSAGDRVNTMELAFDTDWDGVIGDEVDFHRVELHNNSDFSAVGAFTLGYQQGTDPKWQKLAVPGTGPGDNNFNFASPYEGSRITFAHVGPDAPLGPPSALFDLNPKTAWIGNSGGDEIDLDFDLDNNGVHREAADSFSLEKIYLDNHSSSTDAVQRFRVWVRQFGGGADWVPAHPPGFTPYFNYASSIRGGFISAHGGKSPACDVDNRPPTELIDSNTHPNHAWRHQIGQNCDGVAFVDIGFNLDGDADTSVDADPEDIFDLERVRLVTGLGSTTNDATRVELLVQRNNAPTWYPVVLDTPAPSDPIDFNQQTRGAVLQPGSTTITSGSFRFLNDGSRSASAWADAKSGHYRFTWQYDVDLDGTTGAAGDTDDHFTMNGFEVHPADTFGLSTTSLEALAVVVTDKNGAQHFVEDPSSTVSDSQFPITWPTEGALATKTPTAVAGYDAANLFDGNPESAWRASCADDGQPQILELTWDHDRDGLSAQAGDNDDLRTVDAIFAKNAVCSPAAACQHRAAGQFMVLTQHPSSSGEAFLPIQNPAKSAPVYVNQIANGGVILPGAEPYWVNSELNGNTADLAHDDDMGTYWEADATRPRHQTFSWDLDGDGEFAYDWPDDTDDWRSIRGIQIHALNGENGKFALWGLNTHGPDNQRLLGDDSQGVATINFLSYTRGSIGGAASARDENEISRWEAPRSYLFPKQSFPKDWDLDQDGTSGRLLDPEDILDADQIDRLEVVSPTDATGLRRFAFEYRQFGNPTGTYMTVPGSAADDDDFNFGAAIEGATNSDDAVFDENPLTATTVSASFPKEFNVDQFDWDLDESADTARIDKIRVAANPADTSSVKDFTVEFFISSSWTSVDDPSDGDAVFTKDNVSLWQEWVIPEHDNVEKIRVTVTSNHGDVSNLTAHSFVFLGDAYGPRRTFSKSAASETQVWNIDDDNLQNTTMVVFHVIDNNGDDTATYISEVRLIGHSDTISSKVHRFHNGIANIIFDEPLDTVSAISLQLISSSMPGPSPTIQIAEIKVIDEAAFDSFLFDFSNVNEEMNVSFDDRPLTSAVQLRTYDTLTGGCSDGEIEMNEFTAYGEGPARKMHTFANVADDNPLVVDFDTEGMPDIVDVVDVELIGVHNHGDGSLMGIDEFSVLGDQYGDFAPTIMTVSPGSDTTFVLPTVVEDVTAARLRALDPESGNEIEVTELELFGGATTSGYDFVTTPNAKQTFQLATAIDDVIEVKFEVVSNFGGPRTRIEGVEYLGDAVGPTHVFITTFANNTFDVPLVEDVTAARLTTIRPLGGSTVQAKEFRLIGPPAGGSYVFYPDHPNVETTLSVAATQARLFRLQTVNNFSFNYVGAQELNVHNNAGTCATEPVINLSASALTPPLQPGPDDDDVNRNQVDQVVASIHVEAIDEAVNAFQMTVHARGTMNDATDIIRARIFYDVNSNGIIDTGESAIDSGVFPVDNGSVTFGDAGELGTLPIGERDYLVAIDLNGNASDDETVTLYVGPSDIGGAGITSGNPPFVSGFFPGGAIPVVDVSSPDVTPPADKNFEATSADGVTVSLAQLGFGVHNVVDDSPEDPFLELRLDDPITGDIVGDPHVLPLGANTVYWVATDDGGNQDLSAAQNVFVVDTTAPSISTPPDLLGVEAVSYLGTDPGIVRPFDVSDLVDANPMVTDDAPAGDTFGLGTTTVIITAIDSHDNNANVSFDVQIVDTTAPVFADAVAGFLPPADAPCIDDVLALPNPVVTDNGTAPTAIVVTNDATAPTDCSSAPLHVWVTWTASDTAAPVNQSQANQRITFIAKDPSYDVTIALEDPFGGSLSDGRWTRYRPVTVRFDGNGENLASLQLSHTPDSVVVNDVDEVVATFDQPGPYSPFFAIFDNGDGKMTWVDADFGIDATPASMTSTALVTTPAPEFSLDRPWTYDRLYEGQTLDLAAGFGADDDVGAGLDRILVEIDAEGPAQNFVTFDGDDDMLTINADTAFTNAGGTQSWFMATWVKFDDEAPGISKMRLIEMIAPGTFNGFTVNILDGNPIFYTHGATSSHLLGISDQTSTDLRDKRWHHLLFGVEDIQAGIGADLKMRLYIDGALAADTDGPGATVGDYALNNIVLGGWQSGWSNRRLKGSIDHLLMMRGDDLLFSELAAQLFNNGRGVHFDHPDVVARYDFTGSDQIVVDNGPRELDGVLGATAGVDTDDPVRTSPTLPAATRLSLDVLSPVAPPTLLSGPATTSTLLCNQGLALCADGTSTITYESLLNFDDNQPQPHRIEVIALDHAGSENRISMLIKASEFKQEVLDVMSFISWAQDEYGGAFAIVEDELDAAEVSLAIAENYLNLTLPDASTWSYISGAFSRSAAAIDDLEEARASLPPTESDILARYQMNLARAMLAHARMQMLALGTGTQAHDEDAIENSSLETLAGNDDVAAGDAPAAAAHAVRGLEYLSFLEDDYEDLRALWDVASTNWDPDVPLDTGTLGPLFTEVRGALQLVADRLWAARQDPSTPATTEIDIVLGSLANVDTCLSQLTTLALKDRDYALCYLEVATIAQQFVAIQSAGFSPAFFEAGIALTLLSMLENTLRLSPTSLYHVLDHANYPLPWTDYDDAYNVYVTLRFLTAENSEADVHQALVDFIGEKCTVIGLYNKYYSTSAVIPLADNLSAVEDGELEAPIDPVAHGCP